MTIENFPLPQKSELDDLIKQRGYSEHIANELNEKFNRLEQLLAGRTYDQIWQEYEDSVGLKNEKLAIDLREIVSIVKVLVRVIAENDLSDFFTVITVKDFENKDKVFDFEKILQNNRDFFIKNGMPEAADNLPQTIKLDKKQIERIEQLAEKGFTGFFVFPPRLDEYLEKLLKVQEQIKINGDFKVSSVRFMTFSEVEEIKTSNRNTNRHYLFFFRDYIERRSLRPTQETNEEKENQLKDDDLSGFTLAEFLVFFKDHADKKAQLQSEETILFDSQVNDSYIQFYFNAFEKKIYITTLKKDNEYHNQVIKEAQIFEL